MAKRQTKTEKLIFEYCKANNIKILFDPEIKKDDGFCYPELKEVHLSMNYSSNTIKIACLMHEICHIKVERMKIKPYDNFDCEFTSWFEAIKLHRKLIGKSFNQEQADYMLKCLKTYCNSHIEFKKQVLQDQDLD